MCFTVVLVARKLFREAMRKVKIHKTRQRSQAMRQPSFDTEVVRGHLMEAEIRRGCVRGR